MKIYVIGAGPAGMTAAIAAAESGHSVVLLEKNEKIGKKLYITGKGRCNFTNCSSFDNIMANIVTNPKFMYSALRGFDCNDAMSFIEKGGVGLKVERGNRVFPESDKSSDIIKAFSQLLKDSNVEVHLNEKVKDIRTNNGVVEEIITDKQFYTDVKSVILATGGKSYPTTGSSGDGYTFAQKCGHKIVPPVGSLTGIYLKSFFAKKGRTAIAYPWTLSGISLKNVRGSIVTSGNRTLYSEFGEMLFTEKGVSGPIILTLSSRINRMDFSELRLKLDLKPALSDEETDSRILKDFSQNSNKAFKNSLNALLPSGLIPFVVKYSGIDGEKKVNSLTKEERADLLDTLKNMQFTIASMEPIEQAVVTSGGVTVSDIEPKTMRSKIIKNMYFAGEIIDIDALTGGYNIQLALSTGYCAGKSA